MKLRELAVHDFGVWQNLVLGPLDDGVNLFYGPNEAGKTTLMHFVRAMLFGFSPERRTRYAAISSRPLSGELVIEADGEHYRLLRSESEPPDAQPPGTGGQATSGTMPGIVSLVELEGSGRSRSGNAGASSESSDSSAATTGDARAIAQLAAWLGPLDEAAFASVFALELTELQEFSALADIEASRQLYLLSAGIDRSLAEVLDELSTERVQIFDGERERGPLVELASRREKLEREIERLAAGSTALAVMSRRRSGIDGEIESLRAAVQSREVELRRVDAILAVAPLVRQRDAVRELATALEPLPRVSQHALEELRSFDEAILAARQQAAFTAAARDAIRARRPSDPPPRHLIPHGIEIAVLSAQLGWIEGLCARQQELEAEAEAIEHDLAAVRLHLGLSPDLPWPETTSAQLAKAKPLARAACRARKRFQQSKSQAAEARRALEDLEKELLEGLHGRTESDLMSALQEAGQLVQQLQHRQQLDRKQADAEKQLAEAQRICAQQIETQMLPAWGLYTLGGLFATGLVCLTGSFILPGWFPNLLGWLFALVGLGGIAGSSGLSYVWTKAAEQRHERARRQAEIMGAQLVQIAEEKRRLDHLLPESSLPYAERLTRAEAEVARLEQLLGLDTRRTGLKQSDDAAQERLRRRRDEMRSGIKRFRQAIAAQGLPERIVPTNYNSFARNLERALEQQAKLARVEADRARQVRELDAYAARIRQLVTIAGELPGVAADSLAVVQANEARALIALVEQERRRQLDNRQARLSLRAEYLAATREHRRAKRGVAIALRKRRKFLAKYHVDSPAELSAALATLAEHAELLAEAAAIHDRITAALQGVATPDEAESELSRGTPDDLPLARDRLFETLAHERSRLDALLEERGQLWADWSHQSSDHRLEDLQQELDAVEARYRVLEEKWQASALVSQIIDSVQSDYEQHRQPATLQRASQYLERLSEGRYTRIWTKLGERMLRVDNVRGEPVPVDRLSRGTREQLFLSLRLALVAHFAAEGIRLPLVFDDLLVNFDDRRAASAARLFAELGAEGQQLLIFTCHEHIVRLFGEQGIEVRELPEREGSAPRNRRFVAAPAVRDWPAPPPKLELPVTPAAVQGDDDLSPELSPDVPADEIADDAPRLRVVPPPKSRRRTKSKSALREERAATLDRATAPDRASALRPAHDERPIREVSTGNGHHPAADVEAALHVVADADRAEHPHDDPSPQDPHHPHASAPPPPALRTYLPVIDLPADKPSATSAAPLPSAAILPSAAPSPSAAILPIVSLDPRILSVSTDTATEELRPLAGYPTESLWAPAPDARAGRPAVPHAPASSAASSSAAPPSIQITFGDRVTDLVADSEWGGSQGSGVAAPPDEPPPRSK